jgi:hypothetical protein
VSHSKERNEKICLNCGAAIYGRYCHSCGQENIEPKETFWHMLTHFVYDITHFDGKFFSTLKYLLFKPGFISHEYLKGKRMSYLHPIRMYVFTSAVFFLILFSFYQKEPIQTKVTGSVTSFIEDLKKEKAKFETQLAQYPTASESKRAKWRKRVENLDSDIRMLQADSTKMNSLKSSISNFAIGEASEKFSDFKSYDSAQQLLPKDQRDNWIERALEKRNFYLQEKYNGDGNAIIKAIIKDFQHRFPQLLFISLPLLALILKLLYRRRKQFFYVNHIIFCIHLYCGTFIIILITKWLGSILHLFHASIPDWLNVGFLLVGLFYWYKSMRNFYEQGIGKTLLKYLLLIVLTAIMILLLFLTFFIFSTLTI